MIDAVILSREGDLYFIDDFVKWRLDDKRTLYVTIKNYSEIKYHSYNNEWELDEIIRDVEEFIVRKLKEDFHFKIYYPKY